MKLNLVNGFASSLLCVLMLIGTAARAEESSEERYIDFSKETPSGTVEIRATSFKLLLGGSWGSGTLHFQGKAYPFKAKALSVGGIGYQEIDAGGDVYFLKKLEDFPGTYRGGSAGATAGTASKGMATLENTKGVILKLKGKAKGMTDYTLVRVGYLPMGWIDN